MMKAKFNKFERVAGLFVLAAIVGTGLAAVSVAIKQGWFDQKLHYTTTFVGADGVHSGTEVQISGLRAGAVEDVELQSDNRIKLVFYVHGKFKERIKQDSTAQLIRPFIIGDRILDVSVGTEKAPNLAENANMPSVESMDLMSLMSGKQLGPTLERFGDMVSNIQRLASAFLSRDRTDSMVNIFDKLEPLLVSLEMMSKEVTRLSKQATRDEGLQKLVHHAGVLTSELNYIIPEMNKQNPEMAKQLAQLTVNLSAMTENMKVMTQMFKDFAPEVPGTAHRAMEALNEATILMKALQKSFLLRGNVRDVREEEEKKRQPASN